jgi:NADPH:quinone reductase
MLDTMIQATQRTMKAIALDHFGGRETMKVQMLPVPEVGPNEVLIHVEWAGVGQWDLFEREGGFAREFRAKLFFMGESKIVRRVELSD